MDKSYLADVHTLALRAFSLFSPDGAEERYYKARIKSYEDDIASAIASLLATERERCAKVAEQEAAYTIATAIRALD